MKTILFFLLLALAVKGYTVSGNVYSTDGSQGDFKAALLACSNGSTIKIPSGNFTWGETVSRANIGVTIQGAGVGSTTINSATNINGSSPRLVDITGDGIRVTGIAFKGQRFLALGGNKNGVPFRVWNCTFDSGTVQSLLVEVGGNIPGLIDHCTFSGGGASEMIHDNGLGSSTDGGWKDDINPGSQAAVYIENCTFSKNPLDDKYFYGTCGFQGYYGSRDVIRYCKLNYTHIDVHGGPSLPGGRWWEFYQNTFYVPDGGNQSDYYALRGGSGVVFDNHVTGRNVGAGNVNFYSDQPENPPLYGPGAGILSSSGARQTSPAYFWNNPFPVSRGSSNVQEGRDYTVSDTQPSSMKRVQLRSDNANTTYNYKPLVYPHPMDDGDPNSFEPGAGGPSPTPTPQPTATPTPQPTATPSPSATPSPQKQYSDWLDQLSDWIRKHPATPNQ